MWTVAATHVIVFAFHCHVVAWFGCRRGPGMRQVFISLSPGDSFDSASEWSGAFGVESCFSSGVLGGVTVLSI